MALGRTIAVSRCVHLLGDHTNSVPKPPHNNYKRRVWLFNEFVT